MAPPKDPYKYFRLEARELVDRFGSGIIELEKGGGGDLIQRLLRYAHTLKGAARIVKQLDIANQAHAIEDILSPFRDSADEVPQESIDAFLERVDDIRVRIQGLAPAERKPSRSWMRVSGPSGRTSGKWTRCSMACRKLKRI